MENRNIWNKYSEEELSALEARSAAYKTFLDHAKTERECVSETVAMAREAGFKDLYEVVAAGEKLKPGDKVYAVNMKKTIALFTVGTRPLEEGMNILGAHIDSPRIDIKQNPLYENADYAYLDTHYYGGIKKYQWVANPLALHGVVAKKDGTVTEVCVGEDPLDPVFCISDLLIHLSREIMEKPARTVVEGEQMDLIVGSRPCPEENTDEEKGEKDAVKKQVLAILKEKYGMDEEDFLSAEWEAVPAGHARDMGFDRSMILAYGQDDRICAYTSLAALLEEDHLGRTACCLLVDKEEIGSVGATGMTSRFFENAVAELMDRTGQYSELALRRCLARSRMLSSDVSAGYDPSFPQAFEEKNAAHLGRGLSFNKFTGQGGKSGSNDATAEYIARLRRIFEQGGISFQLSELGGVDVGGGGTIAYVLAEYGMNVIDSGIAVLNMHTEYEISSKADIYEAVRGYQVFLEDEEP